MHPLWHILPAAICAVIGAYITLDLGRDLRSPFGITRAQAVRDTATLAAILAAVAICTIPPLLWLAGRIG